MRKISNECCRAIVKAIDAFILKADNKLKKELKDNGYLEVPKILKEANEIESQIAEELKDEAKTLLDSMSDDDSLENFYANNWPSFKASNNANKTISTVIETHLNNLVPLLTNAYISQVEPDLPATTLSKRTTDWIKNWSDQLGTLMKLDSSEELENILVQGIEDGSGIEAIAQKIKASGIREEYYQARRTAITEVLRGNSVAQQEAYAQSAVVDGKEWKHGGAKQPRPNHVAMNGQVVPTNKPFELIGANGITYYPMYPRDPLLPASESVNCHCIMGPKVNDSVLGFSADERKKMRQDAIAEIDSEWEKSLDEKNKAKAGIDEKTIRLDWIKQKDKSGQIKYLGSKSRWALVESGVVTRDDQLFKTITTNKGKVTVKKTLKELKDNGIITVSADRIKHSVYGDYKNPSKTYPNGRLVSGGHSQAAIDKCTKQGIVNEINGEYSNGVRIGNIPTSKLKSKRMDNGQSWFPADWTEDDILKAGTYAANNPIEIDGNHYTSVYNGVAVQVIINENQGVGTIFPASNQQNYVKGVTFRWITQQ